MLDDNNRRLQTGEYKPDDMMQGVTNGLMGKQGNALWMLYKERHNIAEMLEPYAKGDHGKNYRQKLIDEDKKRGWDANGNKLVTDKKPLFGIRMPQVKMPW